MKTTDQTWQELADATGYCRPGERITSAEDFARIAVRKVIIPLLFLGLFGALVISATVYALLQSIASNLPADGRFLLALLSATCLYSVLAAFNRAMDIIYPPRKKEKKYETG